MAKITNDPSNYFAFAVQSAKGTEQTSGFFFTKHLDGTGYEVDPSVQREREGGDGQEVGLSYKDKITADGGAVHYARPQHAARSAAVALGQDTVLATDVASTLFEHVAAPVASVPYLTMEQRAPDDLVERAFDQVITGISWEFEAGKPLKITTPFISGGSMVLRESASALTPTRETAKPIQYPGASVLFAINDGAGGAQATSLVVTKGKIEFKRTTDDDLQTTGLNREDVPLLTQDTDLDITLRYVDRNIYRKAYYGGGSNLLTDMATGSFKIHSARGSFYHSVNLPLVEVAGVKLNRLDPDGKTVYIDVAAMSIKNATNSIWTQTRTTDATAYTTPGF